MLIRHYAPPWLVQSRPNLATAFAPVDSLFNELGRFLALGDWRDHESYRFGDAELKNEAEQYSLSVKLPGIKESDIKLTVSGDEIQIHGERKVEVPEGFRARHRERQSYTFARSYRLPQTIDSDRVEAKLSDGVLSVTLPKAPSNQPRSIAVRSA